MDVIAKAVDAEGKADGVGLQLAGGGALVRGPTVINVDVQIA